MKLSLLCLVGVAVASFLWADPSLAESESAQDSDEEITWNEYKDVMGLNSENEIDRQQAPRKKRWIAAAIGAGVGLLGKFLGGRMQRKDAEAAARRYDAQMKIQLQQLCLSICVTEWEPWLRCTQRCGGGVQNRTRETQIIGQCSTLDNFQCPYSLSQTQACNEGCPHGGTPDASKRGCRCPKGRDGRCCEIEVQCPYPRKNRHSRIHGTTWPAVYQSVVTYTCDDGFTLVGEELSTCGEDGKWSGQPPTCKRIKCIMPVKNDHVQIMNPDETGYNFNDEIIYGCDDGYQLRGPERRVCRRYEGERGRWSGFDPTCRPVSCGDPGLPDNAERSGTNFNYGGVVTYSCARGYHLSGSKSLKCLASGRWLGRVPECQVITCDEPFKPKNGEVYKRRLTFGTLVSFECNPGFNLVGNTVLQCTGEGEWNGTEPRCQAAVCGSPGIPQHGSKDGSVYYYPHNVTFECFNGYLLRGARKIMCQADGTWSSALPTCEPCAENSYMAQNAEGARSCVPCPSNSHTVTAGSTNIQQCICNDGYSGEPGGPCTEIECPQLKAPGNGTMGECDITVGMTCSFGCNDGYILDHGSSVRTCQTSGLWDGKEPRCSPCLFNSYKSDERSCLPCPQHSHTTALAQMLNGCVCDAGYDGPPGGPCEDVDECLANEGRGPCEDVCENTIGSYRCLCSIPGYIPDPLNRHNCVVDKQCRNLTETDAPENGGLICHWYYEENSQQCAAKCNNGFEFPSRINEYETCGPTTGYTWTFQREDVEATFHPCIEEFFPGYRTEANSSYFVRDCQDLNETEQEEVKLHFAEVLNANGICKKRNTKVCDIKDMAIICGRRTLRRRKRGVMEELSSVDMAFNVNAFQIKDKPKDCPYICNFLRIPRAHCSELCLPTYKRFLKAAVEYARRQLEHAYRTRRERLRFEAANREFEPEENGIQTTEVVSECKPGHAERDGNCVPCERGSYYSKETNECVACPMGTYQLFEGQSTCVPCPEGATTFKNGSLFCTVCDGRGYGPMCASSCPCVHGLCHPVTGHCMCQSGWEGDRCEIDIPGCRNGACYDGVVCQDVPAPGSGFQCGPCPPGLTGDGQSCTPLRRYVAEL